MHSPARVWPRLFNTAAVLTVLVIGLAACGTSDDDGAPNSESDPPSSTSSTRAATPTKASSTPEGGTPAGGPDTAQAYYDEFASALRDVASCDDFSSVLDEYLYPEYRGGEPYSPGGCHEDELGMQWEVRNFSDLEPGPTVVPYDWNRLSDQLQNSYLVDDPQEPAFLSRAAEKYGMRFPSSSTPQDMNSEERVLVLYAEGRYWILDAQAYACEEFQAAC